MAKTDSHILQLGEHDNVALCLHEIAAGQALSSQLAAPDAIPAGHKIALQDIQLDAPIIKYNQVIGVASAPITAGQHVHVHNVVMPALEDRPLMPKIIPATDQIQASFEGYVRANGEVGTRNYIGIITTVNCSATVARAIANHFPRQHFDDYPNIDGVAVFTHTTGCGTAAGGDGPDNLNRTLSGYINHPNFAAVLVIGLGCEVTQLTSLLEHAGRTPGTRLAVLEIQAQGGTRRSIEAGCEIVNQFIGIAQTDQRREVPASHLMLGLQCGGSDGWSGVTANPALGRAADRVVAAGGTIILAETPEIHGAEQLLFARAKNQRVIEDLQARLDWWQTYLARNDARLNNNPSPGNLRGGITTIIEKSLGAVAKSGQSELQAVYRYAEKIKQPGFVFMDSPGYDPCSATGQMAAGANILAFTTGRGSVFGSKPSPCIKLASNASLAARLDEDMDIDCSTVLQQETLDQKGEEIFRALLRTASGNHSKSELLGLGDLEFVPWQVGAIV